MAHVVCSTGPPTIESLGRKRNAAGLGKGNACSATWHYDDSALLRDNADAMRFFPVLGTLLTFGAMSAANASPTAVEGTWLNGDGDGLIRVELAGSELRATILGSATGDSGRADRDEKNPDPALRNRPLTGLNIFSGFRYDGDDTWSGGRIYDPNSGNTYRCKIQLLDSNTLKVRGFIGVSLFGRTEIWKRRPN